MRAERFLVMYEERDSSVKGGYGRLGVCRLCQQTSFYGLVRNQALEWSAPVFGPVVMRVFHSYSPCLE